MRSRSRCCWLIRSTKETELKQTRHRAERQSGETDHSTLTLSISQPNNQLHRDLNLLQRYAFAPRDEHHPPRTSKRGRSDYRREREHLRRRGSYFHRRVSPVISSRTRTLDDPCRRNVSRHRDTIKLSEKILVSAAKSSYSPRADDVNGSLPAPGNTIVRVTHLKRQRKMRGQKARCMQEPASSLSFARDGILFHETQNETKFI